MSDRNSKELLRPARRAHHGFRRATRARSACGSCEAQGRDIIGLTIGEPDFETPGNIKEAATAAMWREETKYTNVDGTPELKAAIRAKFKRENGLDYAPEQIMVGNGGKQVIYNAIMSTVSAGDEVITPAPYWVSYLDIPLLAEGTPVSVVCREEDGYKITPVGARSGDHAEDQVVRAQLAVQPDGRGLFPRGAEGARRRAAAPSARLGARRRHLRAPGIRRHQVREHRRGRARGSSAAR